MSSSDSDDSEVERRIKASLDKHSFSESLFKGLWNKKKDADETPIENLKSNRYLDDTGPIFHSDINIPESMQKYVAQKFAEMVSNQFEFCDLPDPIKHDENWEVPDRDFDLKLVSNAIDAIKLGDPDTNVKVPQKPHKPKKRKIEGEEVVEETEKISSSVVDSETILSKSQTKHWKNRHKKQKTFDYKTKNGVSYLKEPKNEWTDARNKNNWTESKIKGFRKSKK